MAVTSEGRVALYLQDEHTIREGMAYAVLAEECTGCQKILDGVRLAAERMQGETA